MDQPELPYFCHSASGKIFDDSGWWLFCSVEWGIIDFYGWLARRYGMNLVKGSWSGPHVSIVRGEEPVDKNLWRRLQKVEVPFQYSNQIRANDGHIWLDVEPTHFNEIRRELGLPSRRGFHITLGRFKWFRNN